MKSSILKKTKEYVSELYLTKSPPENVFHNMLHSREVVENTKEIGKGEGLNDEELEPVLLAAWFHDTGYIENADEHEDISKKIAREFLESKKYPSEKIDKVAECIEATKKSVTPENKLQQILCDADRAFLGMKGYREKSELYRVEWEKRENKKFTDAEWHEHQVDFFTSHKFNTSYAQKNFNERKSTNLVKVQKRFKKSRLNEKENRFKGQKIEIEKKKFENKKEKETRPDRGIETMFRNTMRTHVAFSQMADNKANIMISVNTLLITAIVAILMRKLDSNPHLIIPTVLITAVSLVTLIVATIVTRPKVTEGKFTKEDIKNKKANLLFFGNFYNMGLDEFHWGMTELIHDKDYLYDSMIKDFYFLGQTLGKKYRYLRVCYNIFAYGMIIAVLAFGLAFILYPGATNFGPLL